MIDLKVVIRELLGLLDLMRAYALSIYKPTEVVVVCKDKDLVFTTFQVVAPNFKNLNNGQELLIVGFRASLSGNHL